MNVLFLLLVRIIVGVLPPKTSVLSIRKAIVKAGSGNFVWYALREQLAFRLHRNGDLPIETATSDWQLPTTVCYTNMYIKKRMYI